MPLRLPKVRSDLEFFEQELEGESVIVVRDPIRGAYFRFNPLQGAMLKRLDGVLTLDEMIEQVSDEFEVEIPRSAGERFIAQARKMMLLDVASFQVPDADARKKVFKALQKAGFQFRGKTSNLTADSQRVVSPEAVMFLGGIRHLEDGEPAKALDYFYAVLELDPNNQRAKTLVDIIQRAYIKALSGATTDFPTVLTFDPTRILRFLDRTIGRVIFSRFAPFLFVALVGFALYSYGTTTVPEYEVSTFDILLTYSFVLAHMFMHELGHGLATYHYGGRVQEIGFTLFYYFSPLPYCDTSSTYLFDSRGQKVAVAMAGNAVTLTLMCVSMITVGLFQPSMFFFHAAHLHIYIAMIALFSNLVPFLKLDGYYALCDILGTPNLRERSFRTLKAYGSSLLGLDVKQEDLEPAKRRLFMAFAVLSLVWTAGFLYQMVFRVMVFVVERLQGTGLVLSVLVLGYALRKSLFSPFKDLAVLMIRERATIFTRKRSVVLSLVLVAVIAPWAIPWPVLVDSDFTLVPKERREVRAEVAGVIQEVLVQEGDRVKTGQPITVLRNDDLALEVRVAAAKIEALDAQLRQLKSGARAEEIQVARSKLYAAVATQREETRQATTAARLAKVGAGTRTRADSEAGDASMSGSLANAARWQLANLEAGTREEVVAAAMADRARLVAEQDRARAESTLLTIRSPIDGIVTTKHLVDRISTKLAVGDTVAEVQDVSQFAAEIRLPASAPLDELAVGDEIALRPAGMPDIEITCRVERTRQDGGFVVVTSPFTLQAARSGMQGHARLYGRKRSLAYAKLWLPLQRVVRVSMWAIM
jgi:multidrug efflux pump subunit AcrA (membrane-fusion protein)/Zn-dependent protease